MVVGAGDSGDVLRRAVAIIDGKVLRAVQVEAPSLDTTFVFDGCRLRIFPVTVAIQTGRLATVVVAITGRANSGYRSGGLLESAGVWHRWRSLKLTSGRCRGC